jgi:hypothetical protein
LFEVQWRNVHQSSKQAMTSQDVLLLHECKQKQSCGNFIVVTLHMIVGARFPNSIYKYSNKHVFLLPSVSKCFSCCVLIGIWFMSLWTGNSMYFILYLLSS